MVEYLIGHEISSGNTDKLTAPAIAEYIGASPNDVQAILNELVY